MSQVSVSTTRIQNAAAAMLILIERAREALKQAAIDEEAKSRWYRPSKTREKALADLEKRCVGRIFGCDWWSMWADDKHWAQELVKACTMTPDSFILLTVAEAARLQQWELILKDAE